MPTAIATSWQRTSRHRGRARLAGLLEQIGGPARCRGSAARRAGWRRSSSPGCRSSAAESARCWPRCCWRSRARRCLPASPCRTRRGASTSGAPRCRTRTRRSCRRRRAGCLRRCRCRSRSPGPWRCLRITGRRGRRIRTVSWIVAPAAGTPDCIISSLTAKRPTMTRMGPTPSSRSGAAEGEAGDAGDRIGADGGDHQPDDRRGHALQQRAGAQRRDDAQAENAEAEIGHRREGERQPGQRLGQQHEHRPDRTGCRPRRTTARCRAPRRRGPGASSRSRR